MREVFDLTVPWITAIPIRQVSCLLCGQRNTTALNTFVLNGHRFFTVRCHADGMMWLDPQPTEDFYSQLYAHHYHIADGEDPLLEQATLDVHSNEGALQRAATLRLDEIEQFAPRGKFLEVGFGSGHTLHEAQRRGWDVLGIELAQTCVDAAVGETIPAVCADFRSHTCPDEVFDAIGMYSVIEHTHDPTAYLGRAHTLLKSGGVLVLRLPDTATKGPPASLLAHLYHFNSATIIELLRRSNFEVAQVGAFGLWKPTRYPGELWNMNVISRKMA
jgi:SAM-dependent methyltransferase